MMISITAVTECIETKKKVRSARTPYAHQPRKLKAIKREREIKSSPIAAGTKKPGPRIPTVVGIKVVKKAASQPNPCL